MKDAKQKASAAGSAGWKRMRFKNSTVWVALNEDGTLVTNKGLHLVKYRLDNEKIYRVRPENLSPAGADTEGGRSAGTGKAKTGAPPFPGHQASPSDALPPNAVQVYTDGASSGNPGPAGIGVLLRQGSVEKKISRYIGISTNNIAELEAIRVGLSAVPDRNLPVAVYTDSSYAHGLLTRNWKAKKNQELVKAVRTLASEFKRLKFVKVKGHAGDEGNETADRLATSAITLGR